MKTFLSIAFVVVIQAAMMPFCLCHGGAFPQGEKVASCCHVNVNEGSAPGKTCPCPHCDQVDELQLNTAGKALSVPDSNLYENLNPAEVSNSLAVPIPPVACPALSRNQESPPPRQGDFQAIFGVFLI